MTYQGPLWHGKRARYDLRSRIRNQCSMYLVPVNVMWCYWFVTEQPAALRREVNEISVLFVEVRNPDKLPLWNRLWKFHIVKWGYITLMINSAPLQSCGLIHVWLGHVNLFTDCTLLSRLMVWFFFFFLWNKQLVRVPSELLILSSYRSVSASLSATLGQFYLQLLSCGALYKMLWGGGIIIFWHRLQPACLKFSGSVRTHKKLPKIGKRKKINLRSGNSKTDPCKRSDL